MKNTTKFKKLFENSISERTMTEYLNIINLIEDKKLQITSYSRYKQVKAVLNKCEEAGINIKYKLPKKWSDTGNGQLKHINNTMINETMLNNIINKCPNTVKGEQLRLAILISYYSGLRLSEVLNLKPEDITFNSDIKLCIIGKGNKARNTFMKLKYLSEMKAFNGLDININYVTHTFKRIIKKLGYNKGISFHSLRHNFATNLLKGGINIRKIQYYLGHKSLETTQIYLQVCEELDEDMKSVGY